MALQVSDHRVGNIQNKRENAAPELFAIYMQNDTIASQIANESVSECSKTGLCIK